MPGHDGEWSRRRESNSQPTAYKAVALPLSYVGASVPLHAPIGRPTIHKGRPRHKRAGQPRRFSTQRKSGGAPVAEATPSGRAPHRRRPAPQRHDCRAGGDAQAGLGVLDVTKKRHHRGEAPAGHDHGDDSLPFLAGARGGALPETRAARTATRSATRATDAWHGDVAQAGDVAAREADQGGPQALGRSPRSTAPTRRSGAFRGLLRRRSRYCARRSSLPTAHVGWSPGRTLPCIGPQAGSASPATACETPTGLLPLDRRDARGRDISFKRARTSAGRRSATVAWTGPP